MKKIKRKESRFVRFSKRLFILSFIVFVVGIVVLNSYEASLNIKIDTIEDEIQTIQADIDSLDSEKLSLASFSRLESVAEERGYTYQQSSGTVAVVGESSE